MYKEDNCWSCLYVKYNAEDITQNFWYEVFMINHVPRMPGQQVAMMMDERKFMTSQVFWQYTPLSQTKQTNK